MPQTIIRQNNWAALKIQLGYLQMNSTSNHLWEIVFWQYKHLKMLLIVWLDTSEPLRCIWCFCPGAAGSQSHLCHCQAASHQPCSDTIAMLQHQKPDFCSSLTCQSSSPWAWAIQTAAALTQSAAQQISIWFQRAFTQGQSTASFRLIAELLWQLVNIQH